MPDHTQTYDTYTREGWEVRKRAKIEQGPQDALQVTGWEFVRDCGCMIKLGWRLDKQEFTCGMKPCDVLHHKQAADAVIRYLQERPGSDDEVVDLLADRFEMLIR